MHCFHGLVRTFFLAACWLCGCRLENPVYVQPQWCFSLTTPGFQSHLHVIPFSETNKWHASFLFIRYFCFVYSRFSSPQTLRDLIPVSIRLYKYFIQVKMEPRYQCLLSTKRWITRCVLFVMRISHCLSPFCCLQCSMPLPTLGWLTRSSLHLAQKYARIFVRGHYLFRECVPPETDNVRGQIYEHIFTPSAGCRVYFLQIFFLQCVQFWKLGNI